jgi:hypothetical protein
MKFWLRRKVDGKQGYKQGYNYFNWTWAYNRHKSNVGVLYFCSESNAKGRTYAKWVDVKTAWSLQGFLDS